MCFSYQGDRKNKHVPTFRKNYKYKLLFLLLIVKQCSQKTPMLFYHSTNEKGLKNYYGR